MAEMKEKLVERQSQNSVEKKLTQNSEGKKNCKMWICNCEKKIELWDKKVLLPFFFFYSLAETNKTELRDVHSKFREKNHQNFKI